MERVGARTAWGGRDMRLWGCDEGGMCKQGEEWKSVTRQATRAQTSCRSRKASHTERLLNSRSGVSTHCRHPDKLPPGQGYGKTRE